LFEMALPDRKLWDILDEYVHHGGGLIVMPPASDSNAREAMAPYEDQVATGILPGRLVKRVKTPHGKGGVLWNWQTASFQGLLKPFRQWITDPNIDFVKFPRRAFRYWELKPAKQSEVLVRFQGKADHPAILERDFRGGGKVLLFATPLSGVSEWNNYMEDNSF